MSGNNMKNEPRTSVAGMLYTNKNSTVVFLMLVHLKLPLICTRVAHSNTCHIGMPLTCTSAGRTLSFIC